MGRITEKTLIPISLAITLIGGGTGWMTSMDMRSRETGAAVERLDKRGEYYIKSIESINEKLQEIKDRILVLEVEFKKMNRRSD